MKRRHFLAGLGFAAATWPVIAHAQQGERVRRIGLLMAGAENDPEHQARLIAFRQALEKLGWNDGTNLQIDTRWSTPDDIRKHASELVAQAPDVLVAGTGSASVAPLLEATRTARAMHSAGLLTRVLNT